MVVYPGLILYYLFDKVFLGWIPRYQQQKMTENSRLIKKSRKFYKKNTKIIEQISRYLKIIIFLCCPFWNYDEMTGNIQILEKIFKIW